MGVRLDPGEGPHGEGARTACVAGMDAVCAAIWALRCDLSNEKAMQRDIEGALGRRFDPADVRREHRLSAGDIADFLVGGAIVVEVKGSGHTAAATLRQLTRYAAHARVTGLILATARAMIMPAAIAGKPVRVLNLGRAWL